MRFKVCLLLHCVGIDKKETKGRNNNSVVKINTALDAGRVRISRCAHSQSHCRRLLMELDSHWDPLHDQHQSSPPSIAFYFISQFSLFCCCCCIQQQNLKVGMGQPTGAVRLSQKLGKWLEQVRRQGREAEELARKGAIRKTPAGKPQPGRWVGSNEVEKEM